MWEELQTPAGLMISARLANMVAGLITVPVLLHFLGGEGFAAWAILLACSAAFILELGMSRTLVKHLAWPIQTRDRARASQVFGHALLMIVIVYAFCAPFVFLFAHDFARRIHLIDAPLLSAAQMIELTYMAVALRALLQTGLRSLYAGMRFRAVAIISLLQPLVASISACVAAILTGRVDATLICFWGSQILVLIPSAIEALRTHLWKSGPWRPNLGTLRQLAVDGLRIQTYDWAQLVNFQLNKFLLASWVGLWAVAPYEVASRSVAALRSIPASGIDTFLPNAAVSQEAGGTLWAKYEETTRLAALAILVFMIAPLAVAPAWLYAWTGEMGYVGRWAFCALLAGAAWDILVIPAAALAQARGQTHLQSRSAIICLLINVPLSFALVLRWGLFGAALGTGLAMMSSSILLIWAVHREQRRPLSGTVRAVAPLWPLIVVCVFWGFCCSLLFNVWLASLEEGLRYSRHTRLFPAIFAVVGYAMCLATMLAVQIQRGALSRQQYELVCSFVRFKWFVAYCATRNVRPAASSEIP
jgi:O-antigen/teichoic acid export membrane protein